MSQAPVGGRIGEEDAGDLCRFALFVPLVFAEVQNCRMFCSVGGGQTGAGAMDEYAQVVFVSNRPPSSLSPTGRSSRAIVVEGVKQSFVEENVSYSVRSLGVYGTRKENPFLSLFVVIQEVHFALTAKAHSMRQQWLSQLEGSLFSSF